MAFEVKSIDESMSLEHYGVMGMKWGVRKDRNKPPSHIAKKRNVYSKLDTKQEVWKKGTTTNRVTSNAEKDLEKKLDFSYVSKGDDYENYRWLGFGDEIIQRKTSDILISPSEKERVDIFVDMAKDARVSDELAKGLSDSRLVFKSKQKAKRDVSNLSNQVLTRMTKAELSETLYKNPTLRDEYFKRLRDRGFNALVDDSDRLAGVSTTAMIVLDPDKNLDSPVVKKFE